jgi:ethanolamine-phosphate cytidylyltransferase
LPGFQRGDFLIVGIHGDSVVNREKGMNLPIMNLHERVLGVLGCRYVDDVLIDSPYAITSDLITVLGVDEILCVHSSTSEQASTAVNNSPSRFQVASELGILKEINVESNFRIESLIQRIQANAVALQTKFERKSKDEEVYMASLMKNC